MNKEEKLGRFLLPLIMVVMAVTKLANGEGYERICVAISDNEIQCVATNKVEKYLSGVGVGGLQIPGQQGGNSLLVCDGGKTHPIDTAGDKSVYHIDTMPFPCAPPTVPGHTTKRYGPKSESGGAFCSGRTSPDSCKDCCLAVGLAQAGMIAAVGKMYRDTKPGPRGLAADAIMEAAAYGLIYYGRHTCDSNCEVSYKTEERRLK